jgi:hypothetical protein
MGITAVLRRVHTAIWAYWANFWRTRHVLSVYSAAHSQELRETPWANWPQVLARQAQEITAIKAGKDVAIVDRKSWAWPYMPQSVQRLSVPIMKMTPYNLRRMSRTPVPRRAINMIRGALVSQPWDIRPIAGVESADGDDGQEERIKIAKKIFNHPNNDDCFQTWLEMGLEDMCVLGGFCAEMQVTLDPERPIKSWVVNVESVRVFPSWQESTPDMPRYAQMTGLKGERGALLFYDDELMYIKDNPSTDNPFGLGKMEVGFQSVNDFLGVQGMSGRAGADQVHKCFPEGTDVLTKRGWVAWRDVRKNDEYATRSPRGEFQWQRALGFVKEWHEGDLIQFHNRNLTITVTPNHRMYGTCSFKERAFNGTIAAEATATEPEFIEARHLFDAVTVRPGKGWRGGKSSVLEHDLALADFRIPTTTVWEGRLPSPTFQLGDRSFSWEDWAAFLGIWVAEGSYLGCTGNGAVPRSGEYRVQIGQSKRANKAKYAKIEALLTRMGIHYRAKSDRILFTDKDIWMYLRVFGDSHTKYVPQVIKDAPAFIIRVFVEWAMMGDGTVRHPGKVLWDSSSPLQGKKRIYHTASERLADDMQELFQKIGSSAAIHPITQEGGGSLVSSGGLIYRVEEMLRKELSIVPQTGRGKDRVPERIPYSGYVYCAMVPNGTLYCRENGYAFWSGNTFMWWEQPQSEAHVQIVRRHIQNELEGQAKLSIITGMKKPETVEVTPVTEQDLLLGWQEILIRMIANAFDMSAMALGIEHDINRAVGEVLSDKDFRTAVVPMAKRAQEAFTRKIIHNKLGWYDLEFAFLSLDDPDLTTKSEMCAKLYSMNATTPNRVLKYMGMQTMDSPLADLTQFECMLLNMEMMANLQNQSADKGVDRQLGMQQKMQEMQGPPPGPPGFEGEPPQGGGKGGPPQQGQPGGVASPEKLSPGSAAKGGQPPSPKPMALPKFPIASSGYTAREVAQMPVNKVTDVFGRSGWRASQFLQAMDEQEPGILTTLTDEVKQFFDQELKKEKKSQRHKPISPKLLDKWKKELAVKVRDQKQRTADMATYLYEKGQTAGRPGGGSAPGAKVGIPGKLRKDGNLLP